jgi:aminodeoxyfutalosine synthase
MDPRRAEERIYHMAGAETPQTLTGDEIIRVILNAGREPVERDTLYNVVAEGEALAPSKPFRRNVRRSLEVVP